MILQKLTLNYRILISTIVIVTSVAITWQLLIGKRQTSKIESPSEYSSEKEANSRTALTPKRAIRFDVPRLSSSAFENTSDSATYVGASACTGCHPNQHRSHAATTHSKALSEIDVNLEPPDTIFDHPSSGRSYRVYRKDTDLHHRESVKDDDGTELIAADHRVQYVVGSGHFTRSYLIRDDGFLAESPLTWYLSKQAWGLSPGYDRPEHPGFERAVDASCLYCHVGRIEKPEQNYQKVKIREQAIGCERCHGPGSLHIDQHQTTTTDSDRTESLKRQTIVNPSKLSRSLNEAICAHCHLLGEELVSIRGRSLHDFRPGLPLSDFCINYRLDHSDSTMKVVGHVEQMHQSACYRDSKTLTCTTCHGGHSEIPQERSRQHYVRVCVDCHKADTDCKLELQQRLQQSSTNDCIACHMPQVSTDIIHVAFTHHRIGIHEDRSTLEPQKPATPSKAVPQLVPMDDVSHLSDVDRDRNLGLAYFALSQQSNDRRLVEVSRQRAVQLLRGVRSRGLDDIMVTATLFQLYHLGRDFDSARQLEREILDSVRISAKSKISSLYFIANDALKTNRSDIGRAAVEQLIELRRHPADWWLRGANDERSGEPSKALADFERASAISPFRPQIHESIAQIHEQLGHHEAADRERRIAKKLSAHKPTER